jgi:hypothetical protein
MFRTTPILTQSRVSTSLKRVRTAGIKVKGWFSALALVAVLSASWGFTAHATSAAPVATPSLSPPVRCPGCWHPALKTSWQWQLQGTIHQSLNVMMYDVDMFDTPASVVASLHKVRRIVICYIDAGTWESWRPDANKFPKSVKGNSVSGFSNERWLDIRQQSILDPIMKARMDLCKSKGFNGVEFDNVDGYTNNTGFPLTASEQLSYNVFLANAAHTRGLSVALKNDLDQVMTLLPYFDWALDEQCFQYRECNKLVSFIKANKAVMEVEYNLSTSQFCPKANAMNFNALKKHFSLDAYRVACR